MYQCKILADSVGPTNHRLTTFEITYPRFVHAEFLTHRMISRNSASSRAIPIERMIEAVRTNPVTPVHWGQNQRGMQAHSELDPLDQLRAVTVWLQHAELAADAANALRLIGTHKQIANRPLEPFAWITTIATATEWENFFALRCHSDAQPELQHIAKMMRDAYYRSLPTRLYAGEWHLPYITDYDRDHHPDQLCAISAGRCARVSYLTHAGTVNPTADIELTDRLVRSGHMSPLEHVARALSPSEWFEYADAAWARWRLQGVPVGNLRGWGQYRKQHTGEHRFDGPQGK